MIVKNVTFDSSKENKSNGLIKESDLSGHLDEKNSENDNVEKEMKNNNLFIENDYQLYEALNLLKGLWIHLKKTG